MSEAFFGWLLIDGIGDELERLAVRIARKEFEGALGPPPDEELDWSRLILAGSILAQSPERPAQEAALRIATGAVILSHRVDVRDAGAVLFDKLSNARSVALAAERDFIEEGLEDRLGVGLRLEAMRRRVAGSILRKGQGDRLSVNGFQKAFWDAAETEGTWVSASAPTASGKTWLVLQWLIEWISGEPGVVIYLAPTRALVGEIETELRSHLKAAGLEEVEITTLPLEEKYRTARDEGRAVIFVLTQERIHLLANQVEGDVQADLLIVDEAHKIGDEQRGVILQDAVERLTRSNPRMRAVFVSPSTDNPEILLADAPEDRTKEVVDRTTPTVLQNLVLVRQKPRKPKIWEMQLAHDGKLISLGEIGLASAPGSVGNKRLAFVADALGAKGGVLVYCNGASAAEKTAGLIHDLQDQVEDPSLEALSHLVKKAVHPSYRLAEVVRRGVGFHYGNMPSLVRAELERHFREGKLRYLVCTSTLVEGVNLSCRTIIVRGPKKGNSTPMTAHDFWNLAGRAGRWGNEFQGNIVCLDAEDENQWPSGVPARARYRIVRETDAVLEQREPVIEFLETRPTIATDRLRTQEAERLELLTAYLLASRVARGSIVGLPLMAARDEGFVKRLDAAAGSALLGNELSAELLQRHPGVSAIGLQRLLDAFRSSDGEMEDLVPSPPTSDDAYTTLVSAMVRVQEHLFPAFRTEKATRFFAVIILAWLRGWPLSRIIAGQLNYNASLPKPANPAQVIRETMQHVETIARFRAPKYLTAYMDVLRVHLQESGQPDLIGDELDLGIALEFGVSSRTLLSLIELGLSRTTATLLYEQIARDMFDQDECLAWIAERRETLVGMDIPALSLREIARATSIEIYGALPE